MAASAKILLFKSKTYKDGKHPVLLRIVIDRKPKYFSVGSNLKCLPEQWDSELSEFNKTFPSYKQANINIRTSLSDAEDILLRLQRDDPNFTHAEFEKLFLKKNQKIYLFQYMDSIITRLKNSGKIGNSLIYFTTKNALKDFFDKEPELKEITKKNLQMFVEYCQNKGLKPNTISNYLRTLRAVYNKARNEENFDYYPFKNFNWKPLKSKTQKRAISKVDMIRIMNFPAKPGTSLFDARELFTFMYLCYGLNFSDLAKLEEPNIYQVDNLFILKYERSKGGKLYEIPLNEKTLKILEYYRESNKDSKYIFPILNEDIHITPKQINTRIKTAIKKFNADMKTIGEKLKIPAKLTSYVSRHTFASVLVKAGADIFTISEMMGHSDLQTTKIYIQDLDFTEKIEASKNLID
jgi:integrase/recombinase XerD